MWMMLLSRGPFPSESRRAADRLARLRPPSRPTFEKRPPAPLPGSALGSERMSLA